MLQFSNRIKQFLTSGGSNTNQKHYLLIQSDQSKENGADLIACARHTIVENFKETLGTQTSYFVIDLIENQ